MQVQSIGLGVIPQPVDDQSGPEVESVYIPGPRGYHGGGAAGSNFAGDWDMSIGAGAARQSWQTTTLSPRTQRQPSLASRPEIIYSPAAKRAGSVCRSCPPVLLLFCITRGSLLTNALYALTDLAQKRG